jgi:hypothetical protein
LKCYRPLTLLPTLGKLLEKTILDRLQTHIDQQGLISDRQYGFKQGCGTVDLLLELRRHVHTTDSNMTLAVYLDIAGAFDNAWWPLILTRLRDTNCPANLYMLLNDYLRHRLIRHTDYQTDITRQVTMGCPQGSILGPTLWNLLIDSLLTTDLGPHVTTLAYADDCILLIDGQTRRDVQDRTNTTLEKLTDWGRYNRLHFSGPKTKCTLLKGAQIRRPTIRLNGLPVQYLSHKKILGLNITENFKFHQHVEMTCNTAKMTFNRLRHVTNKQWGLDSDSLTLLYKTIFLGIITYAAPVWADLITRQTYRTLHSTQRLALVALTKSYRTASFDALTVISGQPPLDLLLPLKQQTFLTRREGGDRDRVKQLTQDMRQEWQERWTNSDKGRHTYLFFPTIETRLRLKIKLDYYLTQGLTGHGKFRQKLHSFRLTDTPNCLDCGDIDTPTHALFDCPALTSTLDRQQLLPLDSDHKVLQFRQHTHLTLRQRDNS